MACSEGCGESVSRTVGLFVAACLWAAGSAAAAVPDADSVAPLTHVTRQQGGVLPPEEMALSFEHLDLSMKIDPAAHSIAGDATLTLKPSTAIGSVILDLYSLYSIEAVYLNKQKLSATAYHDTDGKLVITPRMRLAAGRLFTVRIVYAGIPHVAKRPPWDGGVVWSTAPDGQAWVGSSVWGGGCDMLWPCIDHPRRRPALADLHYTVPAPLVAPANGVLTGMTERDGWRTYSWRARNPHTYGIVINVGPFKLLQTDYQSRFGNLIPLKFWYLPGEEQQAAALFGEFSTMLDFFESQFGPYPWWDQKMGVVETPFSGMEHQTINGYGSHYAKTMYGYDNLLEHEFAHEYFANSFLGNYDDLWLHEGFASYMQPLFGKYLHGDMDYYSMLMNQRAGIVNEQPLVTGRERSEQEVYADHSTGPTGDVYGKGSLILHSLRELIGDAAFYESARWLLYGRADPKPGNFSSHFATTQNFIDIVNRVTHTDYSWFFNVYLYHAPLPKLVAVRDGNVLRLDWQTPENRSFPMPVEVQVGERVIRVPMDSGHGELQLEASAAITLDPHSKLLRQSDAIDQFRAWKSAQPK